MSKNYKQLNCESLLVYLKERWNGFDDSRRPAIATVLFGNDFNAENVVVKEIGDGNLNFVYLASNESANAHVLVKQAVPFVRVAPTWPLTATRAHYEAAWLKEQTTNEKTKTAVPQLIDYDEEMCLLIMEYLPSPYTVLRGLLINGIKVDNVGHQVGKFAGNSLTRWSVLNAENDLKQRAALLSSFANNHAMCSITEKVIFIEPYLNNIEHNRHSKQIDDIVNDIRKDALLLKRASQLRNNFLTKAETLLHGDLHTGSIMASAHQPMKVIDGEFAFVGPMAFDSGLFVGNMLMSLLSQRARADNDAAAVTFAEWLGDQIQCFWKSFVDSIVELWTDKQSLLVKDEFLNELLQDTCGFAAMEMIRRNVGISHVDDIDKINDENKRVKAERAVLNVARKLMTEKFENIEAVVQLALKEFSQL